MDDAIPTRLCGDVTRLRQVLVNLLSNGIKFTAEGEVTVQTKVLSAPDQDGTNSEPWQLHFLVRDTGIGIPADRLARLFQFFSQADVSTSRYYGGTGLGLAISKRLVELMGGRMWVESVPKKGSTFHFTLPLQAAANAPPLPLQGPEPQLTGLRLLIVDDNPTNCRILTLQTRKWGMLPRATQRPPQAIQWLRAGENFDLAVLDMQMPGMDGLRLAGEIRKLPGGSSLPLVLLTSVGVHSDSPDFTSAALAGCLTKPIKPGQLREVLIRAISGTKAPAPAPSTRLDPTLANRLPLRVLLCDDNVVNQKVAARLLKQMGYRSDIAATGIEALAALDRQSYDLIFMDVMMPEMGGSEATRIIRERQSQPAQFPNYKSPIIIIAMTASAMQGDREKCLAVGMNDYVAKPVRLEDVRAIVERWGPVAGKAEAIQERTLNLEQPTIQQSSNPAIHQSNIHQSTNPPIQPTAQEEAPVDMERLLDFANGDLESLRELVTLYIDQTATQVGQITAAVQAGRAGEVRRLAHSCAGACATCGIHRMVSLLRELERQGHEGTLTNAADLSRQISEEFECIRTFLEAQVVSQTNLTAKPRPCH